MARRKHNLDMNVDRRKAGWEAQVLGQASTREVEDDLSTAYKRKTYLLTPGMIEEIAGSARDEGMPINEFVRFLLRHALDEVKDGNLELPGKVVMVKQRVRE